MFMSNQLYRIIRDMTEAISRVTVPAAKNNEDPN